MISIFKSSELQCRITRTHHIRVDSAYSSAFIDDQKIWVRSIFKVSRKDSRTLFSQDDIFKKEFPKEKIWELCEEISVSVRVAVFIHLLTSSNFNINLTGHQHFCFSCRMVMIRSWKSFVIWGSNYMWSFDLIWSTSNRLYWVYRWSFIDFVIEFQVIRGFLKIALFYRTTIKHVIPLVCAHWCQTPNHDLTLSM